MIEYKIIIITGDLKTEYKEKFEINSEPSFNKWKFLTAIPNLSKKINSKNLGIVKYYINDKQQFGNY